MMEWGAARILALRKHAGMTQARFAQWLGVSVKQVKYLEHQRRNPSGPSRRLLDILAVKFHFSGTEEVLVLGAGATHLKPPPDNPKPQTASAQPRDAAKSPDKPPAPDVEKKDPVVTVSAPVPDDEAFVWR